MKLPTKTNWLFWVLGLVLGMALMRGGEWLYSRYQENKEWDSINLTRRYKGGETVLHRTVRDWKLPEKKKNRKIQYLIDRGADVNATSRSGKTPLYLAHRKPDLETMELLIENGADVATKDGSGITPLFWVAQRGMVAQAELLIANGADVNAPDNWGLTPLHQAVFACNTGMVECLLSHGADPNYSTRDGDTPRGEAAIRYPDMLPIFEKYSFNPPSPHVLPPVEPGTFQAVTPDGKPYVPGKPVPFGDGSTMLSVGGPSFEESSKP